MLLLWTCHSSSFWVIVFILAKWQVDKSFFYFKLEHPLVQVLFSHIILVMEHFASRQVHAICQATLKNACQVDKCFSTCHRFFSSRQVLLNLSWGISSWQVHATCQATPKNACQVDKYFSTCHGVFFKLTSIGISPLSEKSSCQVDKYFSTCHGAFFK